jgi:hypothetical protein
MYGATTSSLLVPSGSAALGFAFVCLPVSLTVTTNTRPVHYLSEFTLNAPIAHFIYI